MSVSFSVEIIAFFFFLFECIWFRYLVFSDSSSFKSKKFVTYIVINCNSLLLHWDWILVQNAQFIYEYSTPDESLIKLKKKQRQTNKITHPPPPPRNCPPQILL